MTARELIEQEFVAHGGNPKVCEAEPHGYDLAAERVIDRLQRRVEELQDDIESMVEAQPSERERYRDRLDRMVAALNAGTEIYPTWDKQVSAAASALSAIDAAVEERK